MGKVPMLRCGASCFSQYIAVCLWDKLVEHKNKLHQW